MLTVHVFVVGMGVVKTVRRRESVVVAEGRIRVDRAICRGGPSIGVECGRNHLSAIGHHWGEAVSRVRHVMSPAIWHGHTRWRSNATGKRSWG